MTRHTTRIMALGVVAGTALLAGCLDGTSSGNEDESTAAPVPDQVQTQQFDASDHDQPVYVDLATGETVPLSAEEAAASEAWHLALRRHHVSLNGGTSGPGDVRGALVAAQGDFYHEDGTPNPSVFTNTAPADSLSVLLDEVDEPDAVDWSADSVTTPFGDDWHIYNFTTGDFLPNPDNGWLLRAGNGDSYARVRITELEFDSRAGQGVEHFRFEFDVQVPDTQQFSVDAVFTGSLPAGGGDACFDFDIDQTVACTGVDWDLQIGLEGRDFYLRSNSGVSGDGSGGVFGPIAWSDLAAYDSATVTPEGVSIAGHYEPDASVGIFDEHGWYAYDLTGQHQLWPNYRVYLIDTEYGDDTADRYALQVINYYHATGESGHPELRWRPVE